MARQIKNISTAVRFLDDTRQDGIYRKPLKFDPGEEKTVSDEVYRYLSSVDTTYFTITAVADDIIDTDTEILALINDLKTTAGFPLTSADGVATAVVAASTQTASYVQADVQSIADLANDLKAKYDALVTLVNEMKTKINNV